MLPTRWRLFRIICLIQMAFAALEFLSALYSAFAREQHVFFILQVVSFGCVFFFANLALELLNVNYPSTPLDLKQKSQFNWLYAANFFIVSFLLVRFFILIKSLIVLFQFEQTTSNFLLLLIGPIWQLLFLSFQITLLVGTFKLRRELLRNFYAEAEQLSSGI